MRICENKKQKMKTKDEKIYEGSEYMKEAKVINEPKIFSVKTNNITYYTSGNKAYPKVFFGFFDKDLYIPNTKSKDLLPKQILQNKINAYNNDKDIMKNLEKIVDIANIDSANIDVINGYDMSEVKFNNIQLMCQVHGYDVIHYNDNTIDNVHKKEDVFNIEEMQIGDAIVTDKKGVLLAVGTADCVPILLHDKDMKWVAAVHGGWKGALAGIIEETLNKIVLLYNTKASDIIVSIGPSIHQESYEVDLMVYQNFIDKSIDNKRFFIDSINTGYFMFDIRAYCSYIIEKFGVKNEYISNIDINTYTNTDKFFSYRYNTHKIDHLKNRIDNIFNGIQLSVIGLFD